MDDRFAREGTLARCNADSEATVNDIECANARRAAAAIALREERTRREELELESERKLSALRRQVEERERQARDAEIRAAEAEKQAYEAQWSRRRLEPLSIPPNIAPLPGGSSLKEITVPNRLVWRPGLD